MFTNICKTRSRTVDIERQNFYNVWLKYHLIKIALTMFNNIYIAIFLLDLALKPGCRRNKVIVTSGGLILTD